MGSLFFDEMIWEEMLLFAKVRNDLFLDSVNELVELLTLKQGLN